MRAQAWALGWDLDVGLFAGLSEIPTTTSLVVEAMNIGSKSWTRQIRQILSAKDSLPDLVHLTELLGPPSARQVADLWRAGAAEAGAPRCDGVRARSSQAGALGDGAAEAGASACAGVGLVAPVAVSDEGVVEVDLAPDGPHALVVGGTGSGKSEFLSTLILSLARTYSPEDVRFVFIDFKGGAGLAHLDGLPHVEHCISDLDGPQVAWLLRALDGALQRRKRTMAELGARSWDEARALEGTSTQIVGPRLVVVVDEFQVLSETHPDLMDRLTKLAAQGRSLGFHLVLASQRPSGAVTPTLRSTLDLRVALRCTEERDSIEVLGSTAAAALPHSGRRRAAVARGRGSVACVGRCRFRRAGGGEPATPQPGAHDPARARPGRGRA